MSNAVFANDKKRRSVRIAVIAAGLGVMGCFAAAFTFVDNADARADPVDVAERAR